MTPRQIYLSEKGKELAKKYDKLWHKRVELRDECDILTVDMYYLRAQMTNIKHELWYFLDHPKSENK